MSHLYFFLLGRTPELSKRELAAVMPGKDFKEIAPEMLSVELENDEEARKIFNSLGGSLKVMRDDGKFTNVTDEELHTYAAAFLAQNTRPTFGIAEFGRDILPKIEHQVIKNKLKDRDIGSRFIEGPRSGLSASVLLHKDVIELNIIRVGEITYFAQTVAVQNIDDWTRRDRGKIYADRKKGMLPPKVARIMVNLGLGHWQQENAEATQPVLYDAFCGSGTILLEGLMRGCDVVGSDLDIHAVAGTRDNLEWFDKTYTQTEKKWSVFHSDVANAKPEQFPQKPSIIVTEPFLGKQTPQGTQLAGMFKGLDKLYWGAFRQWTKILQPNGIIIIIFPYVQAGKLSFSLEGMIDKLKTLGYTPLSEPVMYHRPEAVVQRQIWEFKFTK